MMSQTPDAPQFSSKFALKKIQDDERNQDDIVILNFPQDFLFKLQDEVTFFKKYRQIERDFSNGWLSEMIPLSGLWAVPTGQKQMPSVRDWEKEVGILAKNVKIKYRPQMQM